jgi:hypothetical protein
MPVTQTIHAETVDFVCAPSGAITAQITTPQGETINIVLRRPIPAARSFSEAIHKRRRLTAAPLRQAGGHA